MTTNYPSNSHKSRDEKVEETTEGRVVREKIITGEVVKRKKPLGKKIKETFISGEDAPSIGEYILFDVLLPAAKDMIVDAGKEALERTFYGRSAPRSSSIAKTAVTSYNKFYNKTKATGSYSGGSMRRDETPAVRDIRESEEIILDNRGDAEAILQQLVDLIREFDVATVADLYDMLGMTGTFVDNKFGWTDLRGARVERVRGGYLLDIPKPSPID